MSGKAFGERFAVIPESVLYAPISANAFRLFAILQRHSDALGHCYPGRNRLAEIMQVSHDTISRAKKELIDAGFLTCVERFDDAGRRTTDDLFLHPAHDAPMPGARRKDASTGRRKDASTYIDAVELEPEERDFATTPQNGTPGDPIPVWSDQPMWQDAKGRWIIGPEPEPVEERRDLA